MHGLAKCCNNSDIVRSPLWCMAAPCTARHPGLSPVRPRSCLLSLFFLFGYCSCCFCCSYSCLCCLRSFFWSCCVYSSCYRHFFVHICHFYNAYFLYFFQIRLSCFGGADYLFSQMAGSYLTLTPVYYPHSLTAPCTAHYSAESTGAESGCWHQGPPLTRYSCI